MFDLSTRRIFRPWDEEYFVDYYWFMGPILATIIGAVSGAHFYMYTVEDATIHNLNEIVVPNIIPPSEHAKEIESQKSQETDKSFDSEKL